MTSYRCRIAQWSVNIKWLWITVIDCFHFCVCPQDHQYIRDDVPHRDHRSDLRPSSSDRAQAHNYKNRERFATIKSASLVRKTMISSLLHSFCHPLTPPSHLLLSFLAVRHSAVIWALRFPLSLPAVSSFSSSCLTASLFWGGKNWPHFLLHSHVCCQGNVIQSIASYSRGTSHWCCCLLLFDNVRSNTKGRSTRCRK